MNQRRIQILPDSIANKIAAGEVVLRPESVVKELLENSLDAGATSIAVIIKEGGTKLIQVTDDGSGMDEQDAVASFQRHATSKISSYEDLESIRTFGFRGEALASIAAVAQVTLKTRRREDASAVVVRIDGGSTPQLDHEGREPGTSVIVQNLFYNVPARRKFLKSTTTEFRHVVDAVHRVAISYPEIGIKFVSDGDQILNLSQTSLQQRLVDVFGERQIEGLLPVEERSDFLTVHGFIGKPTFGQKTRAHQYLFLNRRFIVNRNVNHAVFSAYENLLLKGSFPFFLLFLEIDPSSVDVNVHPSKMEAKFEDEQSVYRLISGVVRASLGSSAFVPSLGIRAGGRSSGGAGLAFTPDQHAWVLPDRSRVDTRTGEILPAQESAVGVDDASSGLRDGRSSSPGNALFAAPDDSAGVDAFAGPIWQLHSKYILAPIENGVMIVDQHVAHERILYERALARFSSSMRSAQQLLFPRTVEMPVADFALVQELRNELELLGFDLKVFGKNTIVVDGVPPDVKPGGEGGILEEILSLYKEYRQDAPTDVRNNLAKSFSCRSAIKAGDPLNDSEMRSLLRELFKTKMPYVCPHGRPVVLRISTDELDKRFGRA